MPFIIRLFEPYIKTWKQGGGMIYAKPKKALFQHMLFQGKRAGLMETKWMVTAVYDAIPPEKMNEQSQKTYRALKGMECNLHSRGFVQRKFEFKPSELLTELKARIPEMNISDELVKSLNGNDEVMQMIRRLRPDDLSISLHSIPAEYQPFLFNREITVRAMVEYFHKPAVISWSVTVGKLIGQGMSSRKTADGIMRLLNEVMALLGKKLENTLLSQAASTGETVKPPGTQTASSTAVNIQEL